MNKVRITVCVASIFALGFWSVGNETKVQASSSVIEGTGHVKYYGFYGTTYGDQGISAYPGSVNVSITGPFTADNPAQYIDWKAADGVSSIYQVGYIFFDGEKLLADYQARWNNLVPKIASDVANHSIAAFYLYDEPYGNWKALGVSRASAYSKLQTAAKVIKSSFPNTPILVVEGRTDIDPQTIDPTVPGKTILFPPEVDWVGFDCYLGFDPCGVKGETHGIPYYFNQVKTGLAPNQKIVLIPQVAYMTDANNPIPPSVDDQNFLINLNNQYIDFAQANTEVIAVVGYTADNHDYNGKHYYYGGLTPMWGSLDNKAVIDNLLGNGRRLLLQTSCRITLPFPAPTGYANGATIFTDNYLNSSSDQAQCMKRATDFYNFFGVPSVFSGKSVTSSYIKNGTILQSNTIGTVATPTPSVSVTPTPTPVPTPTPISTPTPTPVVGRLRLVKSPISPKVYYITEKGLKRWIPNEKVFLSYGNRWQDITVVQDFQVNAYPDNILIQLPGDKKVYKIEGNTKRWISSIDAFSRNGYNWSQIAPVNKTELDFYINGASIN